MVDEAKNAPTPTPPVAQEVSQRTIVILVVLTVLLSFIGAWAGISATMQAPAQVQAPQVTAPRGASAEVGFVIERPVTHRDATVGMVGFEIEP